MKGNKYYIYIRFPLSNIAIHAKHRQIDREQYERYEYRKHAYDYRFDHFDRPACHILDLRIKIGRAHV